MEPRIRERFTDEILQELLQRYDADEGSAKELEAAESFIYEYQRDGKPLILRIGHSLRRSEEAIRGEMDWINHLTAGGARVAGAIASSQGEWVEPVSDDQGAFFMGTAFEKAQGDHIDWDAWSPEFMQHYGETMGRIHRLSREYTVSDPTWRRLAWDDEENFSADETFTQQDARVLERFKAVMAHLKALPKDETYHMIHQDAHTGNLFVDDTGQITLFDFDDCCYGHAIYDIAMVLFYGTLNRQNPAEFAENFMTHFLKGYRQEVKLEAKWLAEIPHFLKLREIDLVGFITRDFDPETTDDPWIKRYMEGRVERIVNDVPFIDYDFTKLAGLL